jgi:hypothetical protein
MLDTETKFLLDGYKLKSLLNKKNLGVFNFVGFALRNPSVNDFLLKVGVENVSVEEETTNGLRYSRKIFNSLCGDEQVHYESRVNKKKTVYALKVFIEKGDEGRHFKVKISKMVARHLIGIGIFLEKINTYR